MKKVWSNYSYAIILVVLSFAGAWIFTNVIPTSTDDYMKITVSDGDSLWEISEEYSDYHRLSKTEFVKWVERYNGISGEHIISGDELIIPVKDTADEIQEIKNLASK